MSRNAFVERRDRTLSPLAAKVGVAFQSVCLPAVLALTNLQTTSVTAASAASAREAKRTPPLTFEQHIRPILKANCFDCHGEGEKLKGGLDLRLQRLIVKGGESGPAIVPGDPKRSHLVELITKGEMPKRERKLTATEIETIRKWIATGARTARPEPTEVPKGMTITEDERAHWAFQPIRRPPVPKSREIQHASRIRTPIDAFLAVELRQRKLSFSPDADKITLLRRACFDLLGLPPTPDEVQQFLDDQSPDAYERLIDRLLESPHYGERWARHWLDVAGYADSDGYVDADTPRAYAYKYRDYVIKSLNADKPFDQFLTEQLAGDELAGVTSTTPHSALRTPHSLEPLIATGFLRMASDGTAADAVDQDVARNHVIADTIKIVSTSLLGLSVGCAQCHDHRYDPIPQADYYRVRAVFEPAFDWKNWRTPPQRLVSLYTEAERAKAAEVEAEAARLAAEREAKQKQFIAEALAKHLKEKFEEPLRERLRAALDTPADKRTDEQKKLLADHPSVNIHPGVLYQYNPKAADELKAMDAKIGEVRACKPPEDFLHVLTEPTGPAPATHLFHRGDPKQPKERFGPGTLTVLCGGDKPVEFPAKDDSLPTTGRRLAFARWLTSTNNPLLARVIVNRVWMHHFGRGLVGTPADFGMTGERPTHLELVDWLASVFMSGDAEGSDPLTPALSPSAGEREKRQPATNKSNTMSSRKRNHSPDDWLAIPPLPFPKGEGRGEGFRSPSPSTQGLNWSLKRLHKLIMLSTAYRQSSFRDAKKERSDPDNRLYWRKPVQRLDAEALRDSILAVSGSFNPRMFGPPIPVREDAFGQIVVGIDKKEGDSKNPVEVDMRGEDARRSVYVQVRRSQPLAVLNTFDAPVMEVNCERRQSSTVAPQALMLMNSDFVLKQAGRFAQRLRSEAGDDPRAQVLRAWQLAFSRRPTEAELRDALDFLMQQIAQLKALQEKEPLSKDDKPAETKDAKKDAKPVEKPDPQMQALTSLCQTLLSANEFLYAD